MVKELGAETLERGRRRVRTENAMVAGLKVRA